MSYLLAPIDEYSARSRAAEFAEDVCGMGEEFVNSLIVSDETVNYIIRLPGSTVKVQHSVLLLHLYIFAVSDMSRLFPVHLLTHRGMSEWLHRMWKAHPSELFTLKVHGITKIMGEKVYETK